MIPYMEDQLWPSNSEVDIILELDLERAPAGEITRQMIHLVSDGIGMPVLVPVLIARGSAPGPVLGLTAAVHGNELNGIPVVQRLFKELDPLQLRGTVVGVPVVNVPSLHRKKRRFIDGTDLNDVMPGEEDGNVSQVYAYRIVHRIIKAFDYLVDLHTASFGRINSYYIRADLQNPVTRKMALLQNAQIAVHKPNTDGTLRGAASEMGIHAITLEVGDPNTFQKGMIRSGLTGIFNLLVHLDMLDGNTEAPQHPPVLCRDSYWLYTDSGGILSVHPDLTTAVRVGQPVATLRNIFGDLVKEYSAPEAGVIVGKSVSPINQTGGRILHLGIAGDV